MEKNFKLLMPFMIINSSFLIGFLFDIFSFHSFTPTRLRFVHVFKCFAKRRNIPLIGSNGVMSSRRPLVYVLTGPSEQ